MMNKIKDMGWFAVGLFGFVALCHLGVEAFFADLEREDVIRECMYEHSACEYARCTSVVDDEPMDEGVSNACP